MLEVKDVCARAKAAANRFNTVTTEEKNRILEVIGERILENEADILEANRTDVLRAAEAGKEASIIDRLRLNHQRLVGVVDGIKDVIALPDPVGEVFESYTRPNGMKIEKKRVPLGVIAIIYEARPNVTVDAAVLAIKSGNGVVLRGSRDAASSNIALISVMRRAIKDLGYNNDILSYVEGSERSRSVELLEQSSFVDVVIPRGGESLKNFVLSTAKMPVIASAGGNCHVYVEKTADFKMAYDIIENGKIRRPSVCNATETLLVEAPIAKEFLAYALPRLAAKGVEIRGTADVKAIYSPTVLINENEYYEEYNAMKIKVAILRSTETAVNFISRFGTHHSDAIVTADEKEAAKFINGVDSAAVYWNVSTAFTDGNEFGLGAEMGISTQKLHCRGPVGLRELTSYKYVVSGNGQTR